MNDEINAVELFESTVYGCTAFSIILFISELGQIFGDRFGEIDDKINELDWYLLPLEIQQMLPTIMITTQQPNFMKCFGTVTGSRESLKMVCVRQ